jgi:hypothetical protein
VVGISDGISVATLVGLACWTGCVLRLGVGIGEVGTIVRIASVGSSILVGRTARCV